MQRIWSAVQRNIWPLLLLIAAWVLLLPAVALKNELVNQATLVGFGILAGVVVALMFPARPLLRLLGGAIGGIVAEVLAFVTTAIAAFLGWQVLAEGETPASFVMESGFWLLVFSPLAVLIGLIGGAIVAIADSSRSAASG